MQMAKDDADMQMAKDQQEATDAAQQAKAAADMQMAKDQQAIDAAQQAKDDAARQMAKDQQEAKDAAQQAKAAADRQQAKDQQAKDDADRQMAKDQQEAIDAAQQAKAAADRQLAKDLQEAIDVVQQTNDQVDDTAPVMTCKCPDGAFTCACTSSTTMQPPMPVGGLCGTFTCGTGAEACPACPATSGAGTVSEAGAGDNAGTFSPPLPAGELLEESLMMD